MEVDELKRHISLLTFFQTLSAQESRFYKWELTCPR